MRQLIFLLTLACLGLPAAAEGNFDPAPYLMDRSEELRLALSAAPGAVSEKAAVWLLDSQGYQLARAGSNGFNCMVMRGWGAFVDSAEEFFNPRIRAPICFNGHASETIMQSVLFKTPQVLAGLSAEQVNAAMAEAYYRGRLQGPTRTALAYMMSSGQWLGDGIRHWHPHLMLYAPGLGPEDIGASDLRYPALVMGQMSGTANALIVVPMPRFVEVAAAD
jgi:hypothetical protein